MPSIELARSKLDELKQSYERQEQKILDELSAEDRADLGFPIKNINKLSTFMANGVKYYIRSKLALTRFEVFEDTQIDVGYGVDFRNLFSNLKKAYSHLNAGDFADGAVVLHNIMNGVATNLEKRENPVLKICTLFITRENENLRTYDPDLADQKIDDWRKEGIDVEDFFTFSFNAVNGFMPIYREVSQSISDHKEKVIQEIKSNI